MPGNADRFTPDDASDALPQVPSRRGQAGRRWRIDRHGEPRRGKRPGCGANLVAVGKELIRMGFLEPRKETICSGVSLRGVPCVRPARQDSGMCDQHTSDVRTAVRVLQFRLLVGSV